MRSISVLSGLLGGAIVLASALISTPSRAQVQGGVVVGPSEGKNSFKSSGELGAFLGFVPGVAGNAKNAGFQITPGLAFAIGRTVRYHLTFAYSHMIVSVNGQSFGINGFDLRPLTLGIPIHVNSWEDVGLDIEPLIDLVGMHAYFGGGAAAYLFSSGLGVQAVVNFKHAFISIAPLNFQFQYAAVGTFGGNSAGGTGFGLNMPVRLGGGLRF